MLYDTGESARAAACPTMAPRSLPQPNGVAMTEPAKPTPADAARLLHELQHNTELKQHPVAGGEVDHQLAVLREWQSQRLAQTYADLLADPQFAPACRFFLSDIYGPRDFSQRDYDVARIYAFISKVLPAQTVQLLTDTIELNRLTNQLDHTLCRVLFDQLGVTDTITMAQYIEGYRRCNNYALRVQQIDLTIHVLEEVGAGARLKIVGLAMKLVRIPAQRAGWIELYDFLERGYTAFKQLRDLPTFVGTIAQRERQIMERIVSNQADPFTLEPASPDV